MLDTWIQIGFPAACIAVATFDRWIRRPLTPTDRYCAAVDDELTARERATRLGTVSDRIDWAAWPAPVNVATGTLPAAAPTRARFTFDAATDQHVTTELARRGITRRATIHHAKETTA